MLNFQLILRHNQMLLTLILNKLAFVLTSYLTLYLGISRVGSGSGRAEKNPVEKLMARARPWPGENSKMLARARPQPDPTARGPTR